MLGIISDHPILSAALISIGVFVVLYVGLPIDGVDQDDITQIDGNFDTVTDRNLNNVGN